MDIALSDSDQDTLLTVYIGQNISKAGILQSEIEALGMKEQTQTLLSEGLIRENHWYLDQFLTTKKGGNIARVLLNQRIEEVGKQLETELECLPKKALGFFVDRFISKGLTFRTHRPSSGELWENRWEDRILADGRIWILWKKLFEILASMGLCVETHSYVSTRGGELRDSRFVISYEVQDHLAGRYSIPVFNVNQVESLKLYPVLMSSSSIPDSEDLDDLRERYYGLLTRHSVNENKIAGIVDAMKEEQITSRYRGLLSKNKPFDIVDGPRFIIYLSQNLIEPAFDVLLGGEERIKDFSSNREFENLQEVASRLDFLDHRLTADFYIEVSSLERELRTFIQRKLDRNWLRRIENDIPRVVQNWKEKEEKDKGWGIDPEKDLMNYSDLGDYRKILRKYKKLFSDNDQDLGNIESHLLDWYNYGRNPIMHARTVDPKKYYGAKAAIDFLRGWMARKTR